MKRIEKDTTKREKWLERRASMAVPFESKDAIDRYYAHCRDVLAMRPSAHVGKLIAEYMERAGRGDE